MLTCKLMAGAERSASFTICRSCASMVVCAPSAFTTRLTTASDGIASPPLSSVSVSSDPCALHAPEHLGHGGEVHVVAHLRERLGGWRRELSLRRHALCLRDSLHHTRPQDSEERGDRHACRVHAAGEHLTQQRSEEHTSELQSPVHLVCRLLPEKK